MIKPTACAGKTPILTNLLDNYHQHYCAMELCSTHVTLSCSSSFQRGTWRVCTALAMRSCNDPSLSSGKIYLHVLCQAVSSSTQHIQVKLDATYWYKSQWCRKRPSGIHQRLHRPADARDKVTRSSRCNSTVTRGMHLRPLRLADEGPGRHVPVQGSDWVCQKSH